MSTYIPITIVAKTVKKRLQKYFPNTKWSVRSEKFSMGSDLHVYWLDGPTTEQVKNIVGMYKGAHQEMSGGDSIKAYHGIICPETGQEIKCGNDYLSFHRGFSEDKCKAIVASLIALYPDLTALDFEIKENWDHTYFYINPTSRRKVDSFPSARDELDIVLHDFCNNISFEETQKPNKESEYSETQKEVSDSGVSFSEYKGKPVINLPMGSRDFSFGVAKAQLILQYIDDIEQFVKENE